MFFQSTTLGRFGDREHLQWWFSYEQASMGQSGGMDSMEDSGDMVFWRTIDDEPVEY